MCPKVQLHHIIILQYSFVTRIWSPVGCNPKECIFLSLIRGWNEDLETQQKYTKLMENSRRTSYQFKEHPVGKAMPACSPFSLISFRTIFSNVSHRSTINIPGFMMLLIYFRTQQIQIYIVEMQPTTYRTTANKLQRGIF